jgi:2-methylaconitate cis-trans-isomerase PrpF
MQIDGLGGTHSSTSKVVIVRPGGPDGVDISYSFAQVDVTRPIVDWSGNCGNLTSAVGPFAIDEGLVAAVAPVTTIRMRNENTGATILTRVPIEDGRAAVRGDLVVDGVPGSGAPITSDYLDPAGRVCGALFPTGGRHEELDTDDEPFTVSIIDVMHPCAFVAEETVGGGVFTAAPRELNADPDVVNRLERIRGACAVRLGLVSRWQDAAERAAVLPRLVVVRRPKGDRASSCAIEARGVSMGRVHHALPLSAALCLAAATRLPGTLPGELAAPGSRPEDDVIIGHPKGVVRIRVDVDNAAKVGPTVRSVGTTRTARRLMAGTAYLH